jgi:hypothetical protein
MVNLKEQALFLLILTAIYSHFVTSNLPKPFFSLSLLQDYDVVGNDFERINSTHRRLSAVSTRSPLFQGMGTHYSFLWVGNPPQRVSVIMDTGSHHTAFPCVGCKCGKHVSSV